MWIHVDKQAAKEAQKAAMERMKKNWDAESKRRQARQDWVHRHTCPDCGQCPPVPEWLQ